MSSMMVSSLSTFYQRSDDDIVSSLISELGPGPTATSSSTARVPLITSTGSMPLSITTASVMISDTSSAIPWWTQSSNLPLSTTDRALGFTLEPASRTNTISQSSSITTLLPSIVSSTPDSNNGLSSTMFRSGPNVSPSPGTGNTSSVILPQSHQSSHGPTGTIAGIVTSLALLLLIAAGSIIILRRRTRIRSEYEDRLECRTSEHTTSDTHNDSKPSELADQEPVPALQAAASIEAAQTLALQDPEPQITTTSPVLPMHYAHRDSNEPETTRPFVIDAASLPELVERVAHAVLSHPRLAHVSTREDPPPQYIQ